MRLDPRFRGALYAAFAVLTVTGAVWLLADWRKDPMSPDPWQAMAADMLMLHGGAAMATLMLLGALVPLHVRRAWRSGRNRMTGPAMAVVNAALIASAFGLYYAGSETLRPWISDAHIVVGFALPAVLLVHVWLGRRTRPVISSADREFRSTTGRRPAGRRARPGPAHTAG